MYVRKCCVRKLLLVTFIKTAILTNREENLPESHMSQQVMQ